jgi:hypothetical protein
MRWTDIIQSDAPTVPATGRISITVEQAGVILAEIGDLRLGACLTFGALLHIARGQHVALLAANDTRRWEWGPRLTFTGSAVRWDGSWTYGREITLRASGSRVEMIWDSGTGAPSRFIAALLREAGVTCTPPVRRESMRDLRESLGLAL